MLEIKNLHANIDGKEILKGISLTVGAGEVHAIETRAHLQLERIGGLEAITVLRIAEGLDPETDLHLATSGRDRETLDEDPVGPGGGHEHRVSPLDDGDLSVSPAHLRPTSERGLALLAVLIGSGLTAPVFGQGLPGISEPAPEATPEPDRQTGE